MTELGASVWDLPSSCLDNEQMSGSPATLYISGETRVQAVVTGVVNCLLLLLCYC